MLFTKNELESEKGFTNFAILLNEAPVDNGNRIKEMRMWRNWQTRQT
jgi:hypothetical protein